MGSSRMGFAFRQASLKAMEPHSYVEIPKSIADKIITERGRNTAD